MKVIQCAVTHPPAKSKDEIIQVDCAKEGQYKFKIKGEAV
jgi:hypothetical protein